MAVPLFNLAPNLTDSESDSLALPLILKYKFILRAWTMTFGKQNTFPESFGLLDQAFLSGINFFDSTEMYPVVQRAETQGQGRREEGGGRSVVLAAKFGALVCYEKFAAIPEGYSDAHWNTLSEDSKATGKKKTILAQSTMELEMIALAMASEASWLRNLLTNTPLWERSIPTILIHRKIQY
ncbi:unnamed protein product [Prunus armeniaca]